MHAFVHLYIHSFVHTHSPLFVELLLLACTLEIEEMNEIESSPTTYQLVPGWVVTPQAPVSAQSSEGSGGGCHVQGGWEEEGE